MQTGKDMVVVNADINLVYGKLSLEILRFVQKQDVQLVVMGIQGRGYVWNLFLGILSHEIARRSEASLLLIPAQQ